MAEPTIESLTNDLLTRDATITTLTGERDTARTEGATFKDEISKNALILTSQRTELDTLKNAIAKSSVSAEETLAKITSLETQVATLPTIQAAADTHKARAEQLEGILKDGFSGRLKSVGFSDDDLKDKSITDLQLMESTAIRIVSAKAGSNGPGSFGLGGGGGGSTSPKTLLEVANDIIERLKTKK